MTYDDWCAIGDKMKWKAPRFSRWLRFPVIRHVYAVMEAERVEQFQACCPGVPTGYDEWVLVGVFHGFVWRVRPDAESEAQQ
jgi:hypothetical protein